MTKTTDRFLTIWLIIIALMVFMMVFIGGVTRLTDSGLSMVEWRPLMGTIPPLTEQDWTHTFNKYKAFPEYQKINAGMSLSEFKQIFFWEYFHRLFGRLIGLAFFFPFLYLVIKRRLNTKQKVKIGIAFVLGGMQGLMGWYMVKSGLVDRPDVSHFRLAAHLSLAFLIIGYIYYLLLEIKLPGRKLYSSSKTGKITLAFFFILCFQIVYGAFVAGLDGGLTHNTFPKMGRSWLPSSAFILDGFFENALENKVMIQFIHRTTGWILGLYGVYMWFVVTKEADFVLKRSVQYICIMILVQFLLGVATLLMYVPVWLASMHQIGAMILLLLTIKSLYLSYTKPVSQGFTLANSAV